MYYVYCIVTAKGDLYVGYTKDLNRRIAEHNSGMSKSTKGKQWKLAYYEAYLAEEDARRRERKLKQRGQAKRFLKDRMRESMQAAMLS